MKFEANLDGDVSLLSQTLNVSGHLLIDLPMNPLPIYRCLRGKHDEEDDDGKKDCSIMNHVDVVDASFDFSFN